MVRTINDYYIEALGCFAAYGAPWTCCGQTLRLLATEHPVDKISELVEAHARRTSAPGESFRFPYKAWLLHCLEGLAGDAFCLLVYVSLICEMVEGLAAAGDLAGAEMVAWQLIDLFDRAKVGGLPDSLQETIKNGAQVREGRVKRALADIMKQQGRVDETIALIRDMPVYSLVDSQQRINEILNSINGGRSSLKDSLPRTPRMLVWQALERGKTFAEADKILAGVYSELEEGPVDSLPIDQQHKLPSAFACECVINYYLRHFCFRTAQRWHQIRLHHYTILEFGQFECCAKYCRSLFAAAINTGLSSFDAAEEAFREAIATARSGGEEQALIGKIIGTEWLVKALADYGLLLQKLDRHADAHRCFEQIYASGTDFEKLVKILLLPQNRSTEDWCRNLPWGYACAALYETDSELIAAVVQIILVYLSGKSSDQGTPASQFSFFSYAARAFLAAEKLPLAAACAEKAIAVVVQGVEAPQFVHESFHPDHLIELYLLQSEISHQSGDIAGGRQAQELAERVKQTYFRES